MHAGAALAQFEPLCMPLSVRLVIHNGLVLVYVQAGQFLLDLVCARVGIMTT